MMASVVLALSVAVSAQLLAQDNAAGERPARGHKDKGGEPEVLQDITLTGTVTKADREGRNGKTMTVYTLTDKDGKTTHLPAPGDRGAKAGEGAAPAVNIDAFVGKTVTIAAKGSEVERNGAKRTHIREIVTITEVAAAPAAAAPAPAPAPAPAEPAK